ncbi:uncharacterized protein LOC125230406 [Leguminivora glycinivorella]|uniref:uncharacterized protein LOC125230406 n=1 Tax=Leguminivora glycinivorella TaxID=1035111 RepID=UPI00200DBEDA|nr:uncharacterized protein LOC125230406 [Leguminivora glycinivorella]
MKLEEVPPVELNGTILGRVQRFKYLGHWLTENLSDVIHVEREGRWLFDATCCLWASFTQRAYNALRVQYNNAFRILMGLPRYCSASVMFADAHTDDFYAIMRKRAASQ